MKKTHALAIALLLCAAFFFIGRGCSSCTPYHSSDEEIVVEQVETVSVVADTAPVPRDSVVIKYRYVEVPLTPPPQDTVSGRPIVNDIAVVVNGDSAEVQIPITQTKYETDDYRAYISGYQARMDSIFINQRTTTIKVREPKQMPRFSVGVQAGYGMTPKGFQPYIGIGVSVNLFNF